MCLRPFSTLTPLQVSLMSTNHTEGGRFLYGQFCFCVASLSGRTALPQIVTALRTVLFISHPIGVINRESPNGDFYKLPRRGDTQTSGSCVLRGSDIIFIEPTILFAPKAKRQILALCPVCKYMVSAIFI